MRTQQMNRSIKALAAVLAVSCSGTWTAAAQDGSQLLLPPATYGKPAPVPAAAQQSPAIGTPVSDAELQDEAFQDALKSIAPLTPEQIEIMRRKLDGVDRAQGKPLNPGAPVTRSIAISLKSGERPATIKVSPGWISTITFSDVTGQPWPVLSVTNGNPDAYDIKSSGPENSTNIITISSKQAYVGSNIAITLVGAKVPILMTLDPGTGEIDYRVDAQIDQRGPNAAYDVVASDGLPMTGDSTMLSFLDGVPPENARKIKTGSREVQAWRFEDMLYVRTSKSLLSPAYVSKQSNASGVNVYVLKEAPVLLVSDGGRLENVQIMR